MAYRETSFHAILPRRSQVLDFAALAQLMDSSLLSCLLFLLYFPFLIIVFASFRS